MNAASSAVKNAAMLALGWTVCAPRLVLMGIIRIYQIVFSPWTGASCKYYPSCSRYGYESIKVHGVVLGLGLTAWRLLRCNPWSRGGVDFPPAPMMPGRVAPSFFDPSLVSAFGETSAQKESLIHGLV